MYITGHMAGLWLVQEFATGTVYSYGVYFSVNPLTPELNPYAQRCLMKFFTGDFAS
jgi:hypothetical protein